jgi:death-on-curing protein
MITLDKEQVKHLHKMLFDWTGGAEGMLDEGLLESALACPFLTLAV